MALSGATLKGLILAELAARGITPNPKRDGTDWITRYAEAIAAAVVAHITSSAQVQTTSGAPDGEHTGVVL